MPKEKRKYRKYFGYPTKAAAEAEAKKQREGVKLTHKQVWIEPKTPRMWHGRASRDARVRKASKEDLAFNPRNKYYVWLRYPATKDLPPKKKEAYYGFYHSRSEAASKVRMLKAQGSEDVVVRKRHLVRSHTRMVRGRAVRVKTHYRGR